MTSHLKISNRFICPTFMGKLKIGRQGFDSTVIYFFSLCFSLRKTLPVKENALIVVKEKLKQKEEFANKISESLLVMEQENNELQDRYKYY